MAKNPRLKPPPPMSQAQERRTNRMGMVGPAPPAKVNPFKEIGTGGTPVFGGIPLTREKDASVVGQQKWITYTDLVTNVSIIAAGVRYFLNIVSNADWTLEPADDTPEAQAVAEFVEDVINDTVTPLGRIARRSAMYRFNGYGIQEWTAKRRDKDGKIGIEDIEARPCHTMDRWEVDEKGSILGIWQRSPQTGELLWLPRYKIIYMVEDSLTDNPEGLGLYRHLVDPYIRLKRFQNLESLGFDRDMRGIPIGRAPYQAIDDAVAKGKMSSEKAQNILRTIEDFVTMQTKSVDTSITLDSAVYSVETESGTSLSGTYLYGIELLQGQQPGFGELDNALQRLNREMARIIGVEHLLLGESAGSRALSEDKSRNFYLVVNGTLDEVADAFDDDLVSTVCDLNGIAEDMRPKMKHSDVSFHAVSELTSSLAQMAQAGAVLSPTDPAIDEIRTMLGLPPAEAPATDIMGTLNAALGEVGGLPLPGSPEELMQQTNGHTTMEGLQDPAPGEVLPGMVAKTPPMVPSTPPIPTPSAQGRRKRTQ